MALAKLDLSGSPRILDYGCAKGATLRRMVEASPNVEPYLFDVTDKYQAYWADFPKPAHRASHRPDPAWSGTLDAVMSFYALEHIPRLSEVLAEIRALLRPGGTFYFIVPDMYANWADFIVADHVNHFSRGSLTVMLERAGFADIAIDETAHAAAFVVTCKATGADRRPAAVPGSKAAVDRLVGFWSGARTRIAEQERSLDGEARVAIYGAGIYGNFILSCLARPERVGCFVDQNRFLQGTKLNGIEIVRPDDAPAGIGAVFVGLNPLNARRIIASVDSLQARGLPFFFLD